MWHALQRGVVAVSVWSARVVGGQGKILLILVRERGHAHGVEQAWVPLLRCRLAVDWVVVGLGVIVKLGQSVVCLESVDKVL